MPTGARPSSPSFDPSFLAFQEAVAGHYALEREIGRGGMGVVYLARDVRLDRPVAIKLLPPDLGAQDKLRDRFMREARTAARLSHPHIVPIHAVDESRGFVFYVMAYIEGDTLAQRVASRGPLPPGEASRVLREVASALAYAHAQGVVHRDVKPANILLERASGRAMVTDFGVARLSAGTGETAVGELLGTPEYMSPEQAVGEAVDARSDIYSLGVVGFYTVSGQLPFSGPSVQAVLAKQITLPAPPVSTVAAGLPRSMAAAVDTCLLKDPAQRFADANALAEALTPALALRAEVPVPVRVFLDSRKMLALPAVSVVGLTASVVWGTVHLPRLLVTPLSQFLMRGGSVFAFVCAMLIPLALVIRWLRPLLRAGYGPRDIASAIKANVEREREERLFEHGSAPSALEKRLTAITWTSAAFNMGCWSAMLFGVAGDWIWPATLISGAIWPITGSFSASTSRGRKTGESWWAKRWEGPIGRWLARLASIKLGHRSAAADRPTEMAIAFSAQAILDELPREIRQTLGDVPPMLQQLEKHARVIREYIGQLDASIADAKAGPALARGKGEREALIADFTLARSRAAERLGDLVTTLEATRLDLLRLRAGHGSAESITQHLEDARQVGDEVNRLLSGQDDVESALRAPTEPTPV